MSPESKLNKQPECNYSSFADSFHLADDSSHGNSTCELNKNHGEMIQAQVQCGFAIKIQLDVFSIYTYHDANLQHCRCASPGLMLREKTCRICVLKTWLVKSKYCFHLTCCFLASATDLSHLPKEIPLEMMASGSPNLFGQSPSSPTDTDKPSSTQHGLMPLCAVSIIFATAVTIALVLHCYLGESLVRPVV